MPDKAFEPLMRLADAQSSIDMRDVQWLAASTGRSMPLYALTPYKVDPISRSKGKKPKAAKRPSGRGLTRFGLLSLPCPFAHDVMACGADLKRDRRAELSPYHFDHYDLSLRSPHVNSADVENYCHELIASYKSLAKKADLILVNELAYPSFWPGLPIWQTIQDPAATGTASGIYIDRTKIRNIRRSFEAELQSIATEYSSIICPGSYHDWSTFENLMPIKFPHAARSIDYVKRTSASRAKEFIKVSRLRAYPVYNVGNFRFSVLICSDIYDLNLFFRQLRRSGGSDQNPDVYLVPAFQQSSRSRGRQSDDKENHILRACRDLSWATGTIVVFVNQADHVDVITRAIFIAGKLVHEKKGPGHSLFELDWEKFLTINREWSENKSLVMKILTGSDVVYR